MSQPISTFFLHYHKVTAGVDPVLSLATSGFRFLQQGIITANLIHLLAASIILDETLDAFLPLHSTIEALSGDYNGEAAENGNDLGTISRPSESLAFLFLSIHKYGYLLALFFFGVSLVLLGVACLLHRLL